MANQSSDADFDPIAITTWPQVTKHINALWKAHNEHCRATGHTELLCSDPPQTCDQFSKKPPKKVAKKR